MFDSGVGGLSIAKCIAEQLPNEQLIYIADTLHAPYGEKSIAYITERVNIIANQLIAQGVKALVIACNTATVNAIDQLRARVNIPVIGVEPAIKPAVQQSINKKVAVLVTQATSENERFNALVNRYKNGADVFIQPCPGLVEIVESSQISTKHCNELLNQYIEPLLAQGVDNIVLGCTHYPFLQQKIQAIVANRHVTIVETASPVTRQLHKRLTELNIANQCQKAKQVIFYSSKPCSKQQALFSQLWQQSIQLEMFDH
ncbi:glutamate racemase [Litorilituus sediminis]|uniref:Glutamate racemase n=1 Tax=Litorilituus sediminis TaxID=718192 RepID=A0A4P6PBY7_9GAMM|nr:glutamate racemase [Litorilituus sediminis]